MGIMKMTMMMVKLQIWKVAYRSHLTASSSHIVSAWCFCLFSEYEESGLLETDEVGKAPT